MRSSKPNDTLSLHGFEADGRMDQYSIPKILLVLGGVLLTSQDTAEKMKNGIISVETHKIGYNKKECGFFFDLFLDCAEKEKVFFKEWPKINNLNYELLLSIYNKHQKSFSQLSTTIQDALVKKFQLEKEDLTSIWSEIHESKPLNGIIAKKNVLAKIKNGYITEVERNFKQIKYNLKHNIKSNNVTDNPDYFNEKFFQTFTKEVHVKLKELKELKEGGTNAAINQKELDKKAFSVGKFDSLIQNATFKDGIATLKVNYDTSPNSDEAGHDFLIIIDNNTKKLTVVDNFVGSGDVQELYRQGRPDISLWCTQNNYQFVFEQGLSLEGSKCQWQKNLAEFFFLKSKEKGVAFELKRLLDRTKEFNQFIRDIETEMLKTCNIYSPKDSLEISMENLLQNQGVSNDAINAIKKCDVIDEGTINKILQHHEQPKKWMQEIRNILTNRNLPLNWDAFNEVFQEHIDKMTEAQKIAMKNGILDDELITDFLKKNPQFKTRFDKIVKEVFTPNINSSETSKKSPQKNQAPQVQIRVVGDEKSVKENERLLDKFLTLHHEVEKVKNISSELEKLFATPLEKQNEILSNKVKLLSKKKGELESKLSNLVGEALDSTAKASDKREREKAMSRLLDELDNMVSLAEKIKYLESNFKPEHVKLQCIIKA
jgi:hypothetical protein